MVHKNYKWNLSKEEGSKFVFNIIQTILIEKQNNSIDLDELLFLINNRSKSMNLMNNNKKKNLTNYIKNVFGGIIQFIDSYDEFMILKKTNKTIIQLNNLEMSDWIFVEED